MTLTDKGADLKIVAGGGVQGCFLLAQPGITGAEDLRGKKIGTFQADTLEMLPYDYLKAAGMSFSDVDVTYFGTSPELAQAFMTGSIDSICHIEPYASQALAGAAGSTVLSDGTDVYGEGYTDCVLAVSGSLLADHRDAIKALIAGMMTAQQQQETDPAAAAKTVAQTYFKTTPEIVQASGEKQPCVVDQRGRQQFMLDRAADLKGLGYISKLPTESIFDWSLLEEVIAANGDLYASLKRNYS
jgi:NitT/TauT family transport system substrate-binding protein